MKSVFSTDEVKQAMAFALHGLPVSFAYLYGSRAKGTVHPESDIDIAVGFSETDESPEELLLEILARINKNLPIPTEKLDVQNFTSLPLTLRFRIVREGQLIYLADVATHRQLVLKTVSCYHDEKRFFQQATDAFLKRAANRT